MDSKNAVRPEHKIPKIELRKILLRLIAFPLIHQLRIRMYFVRLSCIGLKKVIFHAFALLLTDIELNIWFWDDKFALDTMQKTFKKSKKKEMKNRQPSWVGICLKRIEKPRRERNKKIKVWLFYFHRGHQYVTGCRVIVRDSWFGQKQDEEQMRRPNVQIKCLHRCGNRSEKRIFKQGQVTCQVNSADVIYFMTADIIKTVTNLNQLEAFISKKLMIIKFLKS